MVSFFRSFSLFCLLVVKKTRKNNTRLISKIKDDILMAWLQFFVAFFEVLEDWKTDMGINGRWRT